MKEIPYGYCQCGCGQKTKISKWNNKFHKHIAGEPRKFLSGHNSKIQATTWKGGVKKNNGGYRLVLCRDHPNARKDGYISEHTLIVEKAMGKILPKRCVVHHINGKSDENKNKNLVACENNAYHILLHRREKALKACGHANWRSCNYCHKYDDPKNLYISPNNRLVGHRSCLRSKNKLIKEVKHG